MFGRVGGGGGLGWTNERVRLLCINDLFVLMWLRQIIFMCFFFLYTEAPILLGEEVIVGLCQCCSILQPNCSCEQEGNSFENVTIVISMLNLRYSDYEPIVHRQVRLLFFPSRVYHSGPHLASLSSNKKWIYLSSNLYWAMTKTICDLCSECRLEFNIRCAV